IKNFSSFGKRLKKNHGDLFKTIGQTAKNQLAIEKNRWSSNWKNIRSTDQGIRKGLNHNASDTYNTYDTSLHVGSAKLIIALKISGMGFGKALLKLLMKLLRIFKMQQTTLANSLLAN